LGFAISTRYYLREEEGSQSDDLKYLISNIKSDLPGFDQEFDQALVEKLKRTKLKPHQRRKGTPIPVNHNLPLEISLYISSYIDSRVQGKKIDVPTANVMYSALNSMVDCLTHFERILRSPIPLAYTIHLNQTVMIYCLSLPFQLVKNLEYVTIPIVFLAAMIFIGIEQ
jgi:ion channel-forming bestrophin family protein